MIYYIIQFSVVFKTGFIEKYINVHSLFCMFQTYNAMNLINIFEYVYNTFILYSFNIFKIYIFSNSYAQYEIKLAVFREQANESN